MAGPILIALLLLATSTDGQATTTTAPTTIAPTVCGECQECLTLDGRNYLLKNQNSSRCDGQCLYGDDSGVSSGGVPEMCWCPTDSELPPASFLTWISDNAVSCAVDPTTVEPTAPGPSWHQTNNSYTAADNCTDLFPMAMLTMTNLDHCQEACCVGAFSGAGCNAVNWNSNASTCQLFECIDAADTIPTGTDANLDGFFLTRPTTVAITTTAAPTTTAGITWIQTNNTFDEAADGCEHLHLNVGFVLSLDICKNTCLSDTFARSGCNALNWREAEGAVKDDCVLYKCAGAGPTGDKTNYDGYTLVLPPTAAPTTAA